MENLNYNQKLIYTQNTKLNLAKIIFQVVIVLMAWDVNIYTKNIITNLMLIHILNNAIKNVDIKYSQDKVCIINKVE